METSYGIEAARAQLGEIADHARITGTVVELTRHGRTVAVIGPAEAVKPVQGVEVTFLLPAGEDAWARMPDVPRKGEVVRRQNERAEETWMVAEVEWYLSDDGAGTPYVTLEPGDDYTRSLAAQWQADRKLKRK